MLLKTVLLILPLCLDSFLVATAIGITNPTLKQRLRLSSIFALFEGGMPLVGLLIGRAVGGFIGNISDYIAAAILIGLGIFTFFSNEQQEMDNASKLAGTRGLGIILVGLGMSIDELAVGFSYGLLKISILVASLLIALQAFAASQLGFAVGQKLTVHWRERGARIASLAFTLLGVGLLLEKLIA